MRLALGTYAVGALAAIACTAPAPPAPRGPVTVTIGCPQVNRGDPRGIRDFIEILAFERLTTNDAEGRLTPLLVDHWTESADGLSWRLTMRRGVRFQDGVALTTADIIRTINGEREQVGAASACLGDVTSVTDGGNGDVDIALKRRCSFLLEDLARPVARLAKDGKTRIGTGPFAIVSDRRDEIVLDANPYYHQGKPTIDRIVARSYDALRPAWADMMRGRVDFLYEVGPDSAEFLLDQSSFDVREYVNDYANVLLLNSGRPLFSPAIRRAISMAIDRAALVQQGQKGHGVAADVPTAPTHWARAGAPRHIEYDPGKAAELLAAARALAGRPAAAPRRPLLEFTCLVPAKFAIAERLALLVQQQLAEVNVRMHLESLPTSDVDRRLFGGAFEAILLPILSARNVSIPYRFWHSPGATRRWNFWGYRNAAVDAALDAMRDAPDDREFTRALRQFEAAFTDDPPAVFLTWNKTMQAVSHRFVVPPAADGGDALHFIRRWTLREPGQDQP